MTRLAGDNLEAKAMKKTIISLITVLIVAAALDAGDGVAAGAAAQGGRITVRTENFPRPPYSGATYYIYEREGDVICTKLEVCNKYNNCSIEYKKGRYKDTIDVETGDPYGKTDAVLIQNNKLRKHVCLTKFKLTR